MQKTIPLKERPIDIVLIVFFYINIIFITYMVDLEQLLIKNPDNFKYPLFPPPFMIDAVHWWGRNFDPVLMARPAWWKATIWIDSLFFGPFYVFAIYAFTKGKNWIRMPSIIYASVLLTNVTIILGEEIWGQYASPELTTVLFANAAWVIFPIIILLRLRNKPYPFSKEV